MTLAQAKSELMQIYGALSPSKQQAIDTLVKIEPCEDAISRSSLIGKLDDCYKEKVKIAPDNMAEGFVQVEKLIMQEPPVNPQEPKWIPVGKKSPVAFDKVLVTYRLHYDDSIHIGIGNTTSNINGRYYWNINEQDLFGWDILAWMPLPEPYKAESEDKE